MPGPMMPYPYMPPVPGPAGMPGMAGVAERCAPPAQRKDDEIRLRPGAFVLLLLFSLCRTLCFFLLFLLYFLFARQRLEEVGNTAKVQEHDTG